MKIFKLSAVAIAITAAWVTQPVFGQGPAPTPHQIVITENSSTDLTATYDESPVTVTPIGADHWTITFPTTVFFTGLFGTAWIEPENGSLANTLDAPDHNLVRVLSDTGAGFTHADESTVTNVGSDASDQVSISITFDDDAAASEVPDTGTTGSLFGLSLMGLAFLRRKLC